MSLFKTSTSLTLFQGGHINNQKGRAIPLSRVFPISCKQTDGDDAVAPSLSMDRRGMLIGLTGLYGTSGHVLAPAAVAAPAKPELYNFHYLKDDTHVVDFEPQSSPATPLRVRRPAHLVDADFVAKYQEAIRRMKALPEDHPCNFYQYANRHEEAARIRDTWLFLPWHRFYIYFFERILGKLIDDPTFALPFWNLDSPEGMEIPALLADPASPLYNPTRNAAHAPPAVLDYWYFYGVDEPRGEAERAERIRQNVMDIRRAFRQSLARADLFLGEPGSCGRMEALHKPAHIWVGPVEAPWFDMASPYTTPRDLVFYSLHSNVDRLWELYRTFRGNGPDFDDEKWLNASFKFVDENGRLVQVKVKDGLDTLKLGYTFENVPNPWVGQMEISGAKYKPVQPSHLVAVNNIPVITVDQFGTGPKRLDSPVRIVLPRRQTGTPGPGNPMVEIVHLEGIDAVPPARFDVYVAPAHTSVHQVGGSDYGEFAGSYLRPLPVKSAQEAMEMQLKVRAAGGSKAKASMKVGITPLLKDMRAEDAEKLVVTLVPFGRNEIWVESIGLMLLPADRTLLL